MQINVIPRKKLIKIIELYGFKHVRTKGSHRLFAKPNFFWLINIPVSKKKEAEDWLINNCIKRMGITREQYLELLKKV